MGGLVDLLMVLALLYVLIKIPFWILGPLRVSGGHSLITGVARTYVLGRTLGAITSRRTGGQAGAARPGAVPPPRRPRNQTTRDGARLDRIVTPEALGRRLGAQRAIERNHAGTASRVQPPRFQQAAPQFPTHDLPPGHATSAPAAAVFRAPDGTASTPSGRPVTPPTPRRRTRAPRRYPPFSTPTAHRTGPVAPLRTPTVPADLRFQPATAEPIAPPRRASGPPPTLLFHPATPDPAMTRRARSHTPAPVVFQHPGATTPPVISPPLSPVAPQRPAPRTQH